MVLFPPVVVISKVIIRRDLKGDPSASAPWLLEVALGVISTPALAIKVMTAAPSPPPPQGVSRCKNPRPPVLIVFVIGYVPLELPFFYELPCGNPFIFPCFGEALGNIFDY